MAVSAVKFAMSEVEVADLATSATFLRPRTLALTEPLTRCGLGERAMRAAYGYLDGTFSSPNHVAREMCCQRPRVHYYVRKLVGQGIARSDASGSARSLCCESQDSACSTSPDRSSHASSGRGEESSQVGSPEHPPEHQDPWTRYCLAYMYAGSLVPQCGRKAAAQLATEKFGVRISDGTARRAS